MIEVFRVTNTSYQELVVEDVTWSGARWKSPRKLEVNCVVKQGSNKFTNPTEGDTILFKWKKKELFRGTVFKRSYPSGNVVRIVAYDLLRYLSRNEDVYAFSNVTLSDMVRRICNDFGIPTGTVSNTSHRFKKMLFLDDTPLLEMMIKGIRDTRAQTDKLYYVKADKGKVHLVQYPDPNTLKVLSTDSNVMDYTYETSIEETATQVKVRTVINDKVYTRSATDRTGQNKFGQLQYVETAATELNMAQLQQRATTRLNQKKGVKRTLDSLNALGDPTVISSMPIRIEIPELGLKMKMYVDTDTHMFSGAKHTMSLNVVDRNYVPTGSG